MTEAWKPGDVVVINKTTDTGKDPVVYVQAGTVIVLTGRPEHPDSSLWYATIPSMGVVGARFFPSEWERVDG